MATNNYRNADVTDESSYFSAYCKNADKGAYVDRLTMGSGLYLDSLAWGCSDAPDTREMNNMHMVGWLGGLR